MVGELTIVEQETFDKTLRTGLGVGINRDDAPVGLSMPHTKPKEEKTSGMTPVDLSTKCNLEPTLQQSDKKVETQPPSFESDSTQIVEPSTSNANSGTAHEPILTEKTTHTKSIEESTGGSNTGDLGKSEPTTSPSKNRQLSMENMCKMLLKVILNKHELNNERQIIHKL